MKTPLLYLKQNDSLHHSPVAKKIHAVQVEPRADAVEEVLRQLRRAGARIDPDDVVLDESTRVTPQLNRTASGVYQCPAGNAGVALDMMTEGATESFWGQIWNWFQCSRMLTDHERRTGQCFDWVLHARPDLEWRSPVPPIGNYSADLLVIL